MAGLLLPMVVINHSTVVATTWPTHRLKELRVGLEVVKEQCVAFPFGVELTEGLGGPREHLAKHQTKLLADGWSIGIPQ